MIVDHIAISGAILALIVGVVLFYLTMRKDSGSGND